uniref:AIG1-type G domain-containing protein n=1 Tax=Hippocampus comes TaxID=109280 RepID=A0A3Q2Y7J0_HIPCM
IIQSSCREAEHPSQDAERPMGGTNPPIQTLRIILLGSRFVGKTSVKNTIFGIKEQVEETTVLSYAQMGIVGSTEITVVDTPPSWYKGISACNTPEIIKDELLHSLLKCPPGPHVFLLVIDADASFNAQHLKAATTHVELLGESVWKHTMVVFTRGDWLGSRSIEEYIEGEGNALQCLVERCGNRYHVLDNTNEDDSSQVDDLLEKITLTLAGNGWQHFTPNQKMLDALMKKTKRVENAARLRSQVKATRAEKDPIICFQIFKWPRATLPQVCGPDIIRTKEMPERRLVLIGARRDGKSSSANTILRKEWFKSGRIRTAHAEARHAIVENRNLVVVVDTAGWKDSASLSEISEREKQQLKLGASKCPPGPHAFLLVIPTDSSFTHKQRKVVQEHMKLLGDRAWRYTMVLFTFGDYLGKRTIEEHIESEGEALTWLIEKCQNRYHVFNNTDKSNSSQVIELMEKIDDMVDENGNEMEPIQTLRIILLGSRFVGKTSVRNTIFGIKEQVEETTVLSYAQEGIVGRTKITVVDTPSWRKGFSACDTPEIIKDELLHSLLKCPPGPHVFLLVIDADASFNAQHLKAATTHVELLGESVWKHTMVVFTRGDWLGSRSIEEYIEGEGNALQCLVERCGNRYHVLDNMNEDDSSQVDDLLEKITLTLAGNGVETPTTVCMSQIKPTLVSTTSCLKR